MADTLCPLPWYFQAIRNNGDVRICCQANMTENRGVVRHSDGTPFNAARDDLSAARNAELMKAVRLNMLNGVWSDECARCRTEEENGLVSRRQYEQKEWPLSLDEARSATRADGTIEADSSPLRYLDIRFGNFCNLACVMCGPADSHTWYEDHVAVTGDMHFTDTHGRVSLVRDDKGRLRDGGAYDWFEAEDLLTRLDLANLRHIYMAGGEPLLIKMHYAFLEELVAKNLADRITLEYNTNLTTVPQRAVDLWRYFRQVKIGVSVDGVGEIFEYHRWPARWSAIEENLHKIDRLENVKYWFAATATVVNVWHLPDLMDYCLRSGLARLKAVPSIHVAHRPLVTNVRILPDELKREVTDQYKQYIAALDEPRDTTRLIEKKLMAVVSYMNTASMTERLPHFKSYITTLEKRRGNSLADIVPQYRDLL